MTMHTRRAALLIGAALATTAAMSSAWAQNDFPVKPIRIVVPYPAGGTTDQLARAIAQPLQEQLGQTIVIENKPGAGGTLG